MDGGTGVSSSPCVYQFTVEPSQRKPLGLLSTSRIIGQSEAWRLGFSLRSRPWWDLCWWLSFFVFTVCRRVDPKTPIVETVAAMAVSALKLPSGLSHEASIAALPCSQAVLQQHFAHAGVANL